MIKGHAQRKHELGFGLTNLEIRQCPTVRIRMPGKLSKRHRPHRPWGGKPQSATCALASSHRHRIKQARGLNLHEEKLAAYYARHNALELNLACCHGGRALPATGGRTCRTTAGFTAGSGACDRWTAG
jgi:hypothetical protein